MHKLGPIVQPARLGVQIYDLLRNQIRAGVIAPGDRLAELPLAQRLGVSRTPVREALLQLVRDGLLVESGRGYTLPEQTIEAVRERLEIRSLLHPVIAARACAEGTPQQKARLKAALDEELRQVETADPNKYIEANIRFRTQLISMCANSLIRQTAMLYDDQYQWYRIMASWNVANRRKVAAYHKRICEAVMKNKPAAAAKAMQAILALAQSKMDEVVAKGGQFRRPQGKMQRSQLAAA